MNHLQDRPGGPDNLGEEVSGELATTGEDPRLAQALEEYLAALEAGRKPNRHEFLKRYPAIAGVLVLGYFLGDKLQPEEKPA